MARTSSKKEENEDEIEKNTTKSSATKKSEKVKKAEKNETTAENNIEDLKNILQDLKIVLTNLGVNISELEVSLSPDSANPKENKTTKAIKDDVPKDSDTLLISETQKKVVLPYKIEDIEKILEKNKKYSTIQDVIDGEYTFPIDKYKNSSKSRFKEAYNLMRKKEKASVFDSLSLATEVVFNSSLNPAVITACSNLDQLDVYLDCLSSNELEKFNYFKVKYEIVPK